ncbi:MAG TPA: CHAD domain-containing protein [Anaerolineales bacterium]|nr:CHAD domain-containing protein [Anaerolineales bacterium]
MNKPVYKTSKPKPRRLLLDALDTRWKNYLAEISRCRVEFSNDAVHDLRVATRRILALIQLLNSILTGSSLEKLPRAFKRQLDEFDHLRDTQVILDELSRILPKFPQLQDFQNHLLSAEEGMLRDLHRKLERRETSDVTRGILRTHESITAEIDIDLEARILQAVDDAYLLTRMRLGWVDISQPDTIHRVRVAFKAFRYMVEIVHPMLGNYPAGNLKKMNTYQTLMGEIQDAEVFACTLADYSGNSSLPNPEPVHCYCEERRSKSISAFADAMDRLHDFWRPASDRPYPWEKVR